MALKIEAAMPGPSRPNWPKIRSGLSWGCRPSDPEVEHWWALTLGVEVGDGVAMKLPAPPLRIPSSTVTTKACLPASAIMIGSSGRTTLTSRARPLPLVSEEGGRLLGRLEQLAHSEDADRAVPGTDAPGRQARADLVGRHLTGRRLGEAQDRGPREVQS